ncbi:transglycosylase domain-containing protein, partial [Bacillus cereus]|uniref:transglycosylase domain-containing protein n=1 Tax=Bacillus cereus TaxID=1396 RepID=UPI00211137A2
IYFGRGAYGAQAAAKSFFDVAAKDLTVPQAAYLAAALNNPAAYDPSNPENLERITDRYHYVLDGMVEMNTLTPEQRQ